MKVTVLFLSLVIFAILYFFSSLTPWESTAVVMFIYFFLEFLMDLGKKIRILDLTIILAIFMWLIMPVIFYHEYTKQFYLARTWYKYMLVPSEQYFSFVVPATFMMILGLRFPTGKASEKKDPRIFIENVEKELAQKPRVGMTLIGIGLFFGLANRFSPASVQQIFYLLGHLTYVGVFYVLYSPNRYKKIVVPFVIVLMIGQSIVTAMFGELVFMLGLSLFLILLGKPISFSRKLAFALAGMFLIMIFQSIKKDYRKKAWSNEGADPLYFTELIVDRVTQPSDLLDPAKLFFAAVRMNQGWLVSATMYNVPRRRPFANGETIWQSVAASFVPRFLWPDKPDAGGKYNAERFLGIHLSGYSMNIGPVGEAYGNFGMGGIIYMFFYGLFFKLMLSLILRLAERRPTLILWLPYLFLYAVGVETDLLTTMNSLIKGAFFTWIVFKGFRSIFNLEL